MASLHNLLYSKFWKVGNLPNFFEKDFFTYEKWKNVFKKIKKKILVPDKYPSTLAELLTFAAVWVVSHDVFLNFPLI